MPLVGLLEKFHDFIYDLDESRYPYELPGIRVPRARSDVLLSARCPRLGPYTDRTPLYMEYDT